MENVSIELQGAIKGEDYSSYVGESSKIELVETMKGKFGYMIKISTEVLENTDDIRASSIFGLKENNDGIFWVEDGKLGKFLKEKGVKDPKDLIGLPVIIKQVVKDDGSKFLAI